MIIMNNLSIKILRRKLNENGKKKTTTKLSNFILLYEFAIV